MAGLGPGIWFDGEAFERFPPVPEGSTSLGKDHFCVTVKPVLSPRSNTGFKRVKESVRCDLDHSTLRPAMYLVVTLHF